MKTRSVALVGVALFAVVALAVVTTWRLAVAVGPDVNNDGKVRSKDITAVVQAYGLDVPKKLDVREQNVDASGAIRVHEQGTAQVNVTNPKLSVNGAVDVSNLPLDSAGNVRTAAQVSSGKSFMLLDDAAIGSGQTLFTPFADVDGCRAFDVFVRDAGNSAGNPELGLVLELSPDGIEPFGTVPLTYKSLVQGSGGQSNALFQFVFFPGTGASQAPDPFSPFARARIQGGSSAHVIDVSLYCLP